jgi:hypothetical protein
MKLNIILGSLLFLLSVAGLAQQSGSDNSDGTDDFDLNALVSRISQSKALGLFTKLSLKQDIDGLLENVRKYHDGSGDGSLEKLRERYDVLVHKLMILLQEKDGELVQSIDDGRDKLWAILSDHEKFASI